MTSLPLLKVLTDSGIGSRRRMADAIRRGEVEVNGEIAEDFRQPVDAETDEVQVNGHLITIKQAEEVCLMLNKPKGVLSTTSDDRGRKTILDVLSVQYSHLKLHPIGRLDRDSTGLLLLTNDGSLTYRLTHPRFEFEKEYLVYIRGSLKPEEKRKMEEGLELHDGHTHPAIVREIKTTPSFNYSITIHQGKKRQVRRMLANLGHRVIELKRIRIGNLSLGGLREGHVRRLSSQEIRTLLGDK
jgi:23S rRNA pseudouridine2605 synthase